MVAVTTFILGAFCGLTWVDIYKAAPQDRLGEYSLNTFLLAFMGFTISTVFKSSYAVISFVAGVLGFGCLFWFVIKFSELVRRARKLKEEGQEKR